MKGYVRLPVKKIQSNLGRDSELIVGGNELIFESFLYAGHFS